MDYSFYFSTDEDATYFVNRANQIAVDYNCVTLADLKDLTDLTGKNSNYTDNLIRWSLDSITKEVYIYYDTFIKMYVVSFPEPDSMKNKQIDTTKRTKSYVVRKESATSSEPINITILVDSLKDPKAVTREVFDIAKQIKDRPVFITIS